MIVETKYYCIVHYRKGITQESRGYRTYERAVAFGEGELERHTLRRGIGAAEYFVIEKRFEMLEPSE